MSSLRKGWTDKSDKSRKMELGCARERTEKVYLHFAGAGMSSQTSCILRGVLEHEWGRNERGGVGWGVEGGCQIKDHPSFPRLGPANAAGKWSHKYGIQSHGVKYILSVSFFNKTINTKMEMMWTCANMAWGHRQNQNWNGFVKSMKWAVWSQS